MVHESDQNELIPKKNVINLMEIDPTPAIDNWIMRIINNGKKLIGAELIGNRTRNPFIHYATKGIRKNAYILDYPTLSM